MILVLVLVLLALYCGAAGGLASLLQERWADMFPTTLFLSLVPLYLLGLVGQLLWGWWLALGFVTTCCLAGIVVAWRHREVTVPVALPVTVVLVAVFAVCSRGRVFQSWDEFSHWGRVQKVQALHNQLGPWNPSYLEFRAYPPGAGLFGYLIEHLRGTFVESDAMLASSILVLACFVPMLAGTRWRRAWVVLPFATLLLLAPLSFYQPYLEVYADPLLAVLTGHGILTALRHHGWRLVLHLAPTVFLLGIVKDSGRFFAVIVLLVGALCSLRARGEVPTSSRRDRASQVGVLVACAFVPMMLWSALLSLLHVNRLWTKPINLGQAWDALHGRGEPYRVATVRAFAEASTTLPLNRQGLLLTLPGFVAVIVAVWALSCIIGIPRMRRRDIGLAAVAWTVGLVVYLCGLLGSYLFKFSPYEATALASFWRYVGAYVVSGIVVVAGLVVHALSHVERSPRRAPVLAAVAAGLAFALVVATADPQALPTYVGHQRNQTEEYRDRVARSVARIRRCGLQPGDRLWLMDEYGNGFAMWVYAYELVDNRVGGWSVGEPSGKGDLWTRDLTLREFSDELRAWHYFYSIQYAPTVPRRYGALFPGGKTKANVLYRIDTTKDQVKLVPVC